MRNTAKWIVHIFLSAALFFLGWKVICWIEDALWWTPLRTVSLLLTLMLTVFAGLFAWFFGGYLAQKIIDKQFEGEK